MKRSLYLILLGLLLAACAPIVRPEQIGQNKLLPLSEDSNLGQTLVANFNGFNGIEVYLTPEKVGNGEIILHLRESAESEQDLQVAKLSADLVTTPGFYRFSFTPQPNSTREYYYFFVRVKGTGQFWVAGSPGSVYLDGSAYQSHKPLPDNQLTFQLSYEPRRLLLGLLMEGLTWIWYLLVAGFLFVLPGWVIWETISRKKKPKYNSSGTQSHHQPSGDNHNDSFNNFWVKIALACGTSLALYPLLFLWTDIIGIHLGRWYAIIPGAISIVILIKWLGYKSLNIEHQIKHLRSKLQLNLPDIVLILLLGLIMFSRFWVIRTLEGPMWGDGMQHTMVTQLLLDNGGLFDSWQPYATLKTFSYHFGFHTASALFAWITGLEARFATLWTGQILNILAVLALYPLAVKIGGNRWAGVGAVLVAGLLSPMPMYYLNWGRYTQLAGLIILLIVLYFSWEFLENSRTTLVWELVLGGILWAGLGLSHYRVFIFGVIGMLAFISLYLQRDNWRSLFTKILLLAGISGLLFSPWLIQVFSGKLPAIFSTLMRLQSSKNNTIPAIITTGDLAQYLQPWVWLLIPVGLGLALWKRRIWTHVFGLWWVLMVVATYPNWFGLPGKDIINYFTFFISTYILAGIALGNFLPGIENFSKWTQYTLAASLLLAGIWGFQKRINEVDPIKHAMLTRPDVRAAEWIQGNLSPIEEKIWIQSFSAYEGTLAAGSDGGWWLSTLTRVPISLPPLLYSFEETDSEVLLPFIKKLQTGEISLEQTTARDFLESQDIGYIYIGQQHGHVNYLGPISEPGKLLDASWELIYHQDRVWLFSIAR